MKKEEDLFLHGNAHRYNRFSFKGVRAEDVRVNSIVDFHIKLLNIQILCCTTIIAEQ